MHRKHLMLAAILIMVCATTATAFAAKARFGADPGFSLGSLIANGSLVGLGNDDVTVILDASGIPVVTCTNQGGNQAPGQNPPKVSTSGEQFLAHETFTKNGNTPFTVETNDPPALDAKTMGCPNNTWTAAIDFVFWTDATIRVVDSTTGAELLRQDFNCITTRAPDSVSCTPTP